MEGGEEGRSGYSYRPVRVCQRSIHRLVPSVHYREGEDPVYQLGTTGARNLHGVLPRKPYLQLQNQPRAFSSPLSPLLWTSRTHELTKPCPYTQCPRSSMTRSRLAMHDTLRPQQACSAHGPWYAVTCRPALAAFQPILPTLIVAEGFPLSVVRTLDHSTITYIHLSRWALGRDRNTSLGPR
ncbi:hypothetical protein L226DRAFT_248378 [Lentinus tigrinus ALCF2SS1-7]|uniref:Uncharacterized protein n=1 Tax=Lentinus tigrinus ALCF2SS1-6 TaxID=1328759 RepID=A0A5C2SNK5_9APHY|nr:hypothetical protein L227DRAFT_205430 [Lentinus tigrinus ALCF2SS1-6]RPD79372.1 hypothetical protein L226DRAFT_248378 [Lentinus tigrinus ALCF2SS1-7]